MSNYIRFYNNKYNYIFITIVTYNRQSILLKNIDLLRNSFKFVLRKYKFEIFACNILKDHIHLILKMENPHNYSEIIRLFKYNFSRKMRKNICVSESKLNKREKGIWQRRFWEHTIRNEQDLNTHLDYIHYNSYKHYKVIPKDWIFSSFKKFVDLGYYEPNWCNFENKYNILELDFE